MKISLNWLQDYVAIDKKVSVEELAWRITEATAQVEKIHKLGNDLEKVVVGEITDIRKHTDADKLSVASVKVAPNQSIQVIFGQKAPIKVGDKVPVAVAPTQLHGGKIEKTKIRGELSEGMLCLDSEMIPGAPESLFYFEESTKEGTPVTEILPLKDTVFEIDNHSITHRADLFSHYGFCRELVALGLAKWKKQITQFDLSKMTGKKKLPFAVRFENKEMTKDYHGTIVENLDARLAPPYIRYRIQACGIRSINALVDITNYVMLELGAPLHSFDRAAITGKEFLFRLSREGETMITLDGKTQKLFEEIMVGETDGKIIDLLGIMGGQNSEVKQSTNAVYFHQDICHPVYIRKAMIGLGQRTDAGTIYEKNIDPNLSNLGIGRALQLTKEIFPKAKFDHQVFRAKNFEEKKQKVDTTLEQISKRLGLELDAGACKKILEDLGCKVNVKAKSLSVEIPSWRKNSLIMSADISEEVGRINGYFNVPVVLPAMEMKQPEPRVKLKMKREIRRFLIAQGFLEELNWSFCSEDLLNKIKKQNSSEILRISNPVSEDFKFMKPDLLSYMLTNLSRNERLLKREMRTFELGKVFGRVGSDPVERETLTLLISGNNSFLNAKGLLENLAITLNMKIDFDPQENERAHPGRSCEIYLGDKMVGQLYVLHPELQSRFEIKSMVSIVELELEQLYSISSEKKSYRPIIRYPEVSLDLSIIISETREFRSIKSIVQKVSPSLLKSVELKDLYHGENIGKGKKSITRSLTYQSPERTIEATEIETIVTELIKQVEKEGGEVRR